MDRAESLPWEIPGQGQALAYPGYKSLFLTAPGSVEAWPGMLTQSSSQGRGVGAVAEQGVPGISGVPDVPRVTGISGVSVCQVCQM